ncbi:MAG: glycosyltransferase [Candidatus Saccharibacteria bacterium]
MNKMPKYTVIVPAYSEALLIADSLKKISDCLRADKKRHGLTELIVVSADSTDKTAEIAKSQAKLFAFFKLIKPGPKVGKGRDVRAGVLAARGEYILFLDADLATPATHIKEAFDMLESTNADLLIADRPLGKIHNTFARRLKSIVSNLLIRVLATPGINDTQCGFKAFKRDVAYELFEPLETLAWGFDVEILVRARSLGYKMVLLKINDWFDPKEDNMGLVGESNFHAYVHTLIELFSIFIKRLSGHYKK